MKLNKSLYRAKGIKEKHLRFYIVMIYILYFFFGNTIFNTT